MYKQLQSGMANCELAFAITILDYSWKPMQRGDCTQEGAFLVRRRVGDNEYLYTISVVCKRDIKHVLVRQRPDERYAIGTPKHNEKVR